LRITEINVDYVVSRQVVTQRVRHTAVSVTLIDYVRNDCADTVLALRLYNVINYRLVFAHPLHTYERPRIKQPVSALRRYVYVMCRTTVGRRTRKYAGRIEEYARYLDFDAAIDDH